MQLEDRLHVLVNNAGATWGAPMATFPEAAWDKIMCARAHTCCATRTIRLRGQAVHSARASRRRRLNVYSIFNLTRACIPLLQVSRDMWLTHVSRSLLRRTRTCIPPRPVPRGGAERASDCQALPALTDRL